MRSTIQFFAIPALLFCVTSFGSAQRASSIQSNKPTIPFRFSPKDFGAVKIEDIASEKAPESDEPQMPFDAPAHRCYSLKRKAPLPAYEKGARYFFPAYNSICLVPTSDSSVENFAKAYPSFNKAVEQIKNLTSTKRTDFKQYNDLFDFPYNNSSWSVTAKRQYLESAKLTGLFFLVQYSQDTTPTPLNNEELTANFQGLTKDGLYYIAARFSITHPSLPKGIDFVDNSGWEKCMQIRYPAVNDCVRGYLGIETNKLEKFSDREFQPSISTIKSLLISINPR